MLPNTSQHVLDDLERPTLPAAPTPEAAMAAWLKRPWPEPKRQPAPSDDDAAPAQLELP